MRLVAEFQDAAGTKYLTASTRVLKRNTWYHVARIWDGTQQHVAILGEIDGSTTPGASPVNGGLPYALGTTVRAGDVVSGRFHGFMRNWRRYSVALDEAGLAADAAAEGSLWGDPDLVFEALLNDGSGEAVTSGAQLVSGGGVNWLPAEPPWQLDEAPTLTLTGPADLATVANTVATLAVTLGTDAEGNANTVEFWGREWESEPDFRFAVLPDTQDSVQNEVANYMAQCQWIEDNRVAQNFKGLIGLGDVTMEATTQEYDDAKAGLDLINLWKILNLGNHDFDHAQPPPAGTGELSNDNDDMAGTQWNAYFGAAFWAANGGLVDHYIDEYENTAGELVVGNISFLIVSLEYRKEAGQNAGLLAWARGVIQDHPNHFVIVVSHWLLNNIGGADIYNYPADWSAFGAEVYDTVKDLPQVKLMLAGHLNVGSRDDFYQGRRLSTRMFDYESSHDQKVVLLKVNPRDGELFYETYDTTSATYFRTAHQEASVPAEFPGYPAFTKLGEVTGVASGGSTTFDWTGLGASHYEWYARVRNGNVYRDSSRRGFDCTGVAPSGLTITSHADGAVFYPTVAYTLEGTCDLGVTIEVFWNAVKIGDATVTGTDWEFVWTPTFAQVITANGLSGAVLSVDDGTTAADIDALVYTHAVEDDLLYWVSAKNPAHYDETAGSLDSVTNGASGAVTISTKTGVPGWSADGVATGHAGFTGAGAAAIYGLDAVSNHQNGAPPAYGLFMVAQVSNVATNSPCFCFARSGTNSNNTVYWGTNTSSRWTYARRGAGAAAEQADATATASTGTQLVAYYTAGGANPVFIRVNGAAAVSEALAAVESPASMDRVGFLARVDSSPDLFITGAVGEVAYYSTQPDAAKITRALNYMAAVWGVTLP
jgi:hypothetical protein